MKRFGIIGHPVAGSLSPLLFGAAYEGRYPYDLIDFEHFADAWSCFLAGYDGVNVTAPFKQDAYAAVDFRSPHALATGAVNLVVKRRDGLYGYNTDVDGILGSVRECGLAVSEALVVGTGGAARAAVAAARALGCPVTVTGRSPEKAAALGCPFVPLSALPTWRPSAPGTPLVPSASGILASGIPGATSVPGTLASGIPGATPGLPTIHGLVSSQASASAPSFTPDSIVNGSPSGPSADPTSAGRLLVLYTLPGGVPVPEGLPLQDAVVLEAEYKHPALQHRPCGCYLSGHRWLLHQAIAGYSLFTGEAPCVPAMASALATL